jgi:hypothetical protein
VVYYRLSTIGASLATGGCLVGALARKDAADAARREAETLSASGPITNRAQVQGAAVNLNFMHNYRNIFTFSCPDTIFTRARQEGCHGSKLLGFRAVQAGPHEQPCRIRDDEGEQALLLCDGIEPVLKS